MTVKILATVRRMDLLASTLLVFRTIRVGFPTWDIEVTPNLPGALHPEDHETAVRAIAEAAEAVGASVTGRDHTRHDHWLERRILMEYQPFVICDTDMVFHASLEDVGFLPMVGIMGPYEPSHFNPVTRMRHAERLHTCLLFVHPERIRDQLRAVMATRIPRQPWVIDYHPVRGAVEFSTCETDRFWDTGAKLLDVCTWQRLSAGHCERFTHLHAGTWRDEAGKALAGLNSIHEAAIAGTLDFAGVRQAQAQFYADNQ